MRTIDVIVRPASPRHHKGREKETKLKEEDNVLDDMKWRVRRKKTMERLCAKDT